MFFKSAGCRSVRKNEKKYDNIIPKSKQICHCVVELSANFFPFLFQTATICSSSTAEKKINSFTFLNVKCFVFINVSKF